MKKNYTLLFISLTVIGINLTKAQTCTTPSAPAITGITQAPCMSSNSFTLTANASFSVGWYTAPWGGNAISNNSVFVTPTLTSGATYYAGQMQSTTTASIALPSHLSGYSGNTRGMWFTAPTSFVITGVRVPVEVTGTANSAIAIMSFPSAPPSYPTVTNSMNILYLDQNISGTGIVPVYIPVNSGDVIGLLGARGGITSYGATNPQLSTLGTYTLTLTRMGMQYPLASQTPTDIWQEPAGSLGRMEVYTTIGCLSTLTPVTVTVTPVPIISIAGPSSSVCAGTSVTLSASGVSTFTWTGGPTTSSYVVTPGTMTTYTINGSVSPTCNAAPAMITVSVDPAVPNLTVTSSSPVICSGNSVSLSGAGATTYTWAGGSPQVTNNVAFYPNTTATYTLNASNACGISTKTTIVTVNATPTINTTASSSVICDGDMTNITASGALTYTWNPGGPGASIAVSPTTSTLYQVSGTSSQGCPASASQIILVNPKPVVNANANKMTVCEGGSVTLTGSGNAHTYSWTTGAQTPVTTANVMVTTTYSVTGTYSTTGCSNTKGITIAVFIPTITVTPSSTAVCSGTAITISASGGLSPTSYTWSIGQQFQSITVSPTSNTVYIVNAPATSGGVTCIGSNTVQVQVNPNPNVTATSTRTSICKGEKTVLNASGASSYTWNTNATTNTIQVGPIIQTIYTVKGVDGNGCENEGTITVKVNPCTDIASYDLPFKVSIYPNPNNGKFVLRSSEPVNITIINELGQFVSSYTLSGEVDHEINASDLSSGIYFVIGKKDDFVFKEKIIITE
jgi:hypothetical protein